jgi:hypothetical protein
MRSWVSLLVITMVAGVACGSSDGGGGGGKGGSGGTAGNTAGTAGTATTVDRTTCDICDVAAKCCTAAVGASFCSAYSTEACLKNTDPMSRAKTIEYCVVQVDATQGTPGCN